MIDDDLRLRARRLAAGDFRTLDLERIYLGLRHTRSFGRQAFREIGDFVAHRDERTKGMMTDIGRALFTSVDVWSRKLRGLTYENDDIVRASRANLLLATDKQIKDNLGCSRKVAGQRLDRAIAVFEAGKKIEDDQDFKALYEFGSKFFWRPAFTGDTLFDDLKLVIAKNKLLGPDEIRSFEAARSFVAVHAVSVMHGTTITLDSGSTVRLFAGCANNERCLEVKIDLAFQELGKPLMVPICVYYTRLAAEDTCAATLECDEAALNFKRWSMPLEIDPQGRLQPIA